MPFRVMLMGESQVNYFRNAIAPSRWDNLRGLTLIEVLIALAVISIALTSIIKATSQTIRSTGYLQEKTIAMWVGQQVLNEARVGILKIDDDENREMTTMLGRDLNWSVVREDTPNNRIKKVEVAVYGHKEETENPLIRMETYVYNDQ